MAIMILAALVASFSGLIVRNIDFANPWQINIYRSVAFIAAILIVSPREKRKKKTKGLFNLSLPVYMAGLLLGLCGVSITQALTYTTIANTMFTMSALPFITMIFASVFLNEKISTLTLVAMILSTIGIVIMISDSYSTSSLYGNIMALITAVGFAGFAVLLRANHEIDMFPSLVVGGIVVILASIVPISGDYQISMQDLLLCFLWGGLLSGLAHWAIVSASPYLAAAELTLFTLFEFSIAPLWVWLFLSETPTNTSLIGGMIVLISVTICAVIDLKTEQNQSK